MRGCQRELVEARDAVVDGCGQLTQQRSIETEPSAQLEGVGEDSLSQRYASCAFIVPNTLAVPSIPLKIRLARPVFL